MFSEIRIIDDPETQHEDWLVTTITVKNDFVGVRRRINNDGYKINSDGSTGSRLAPWSLYNPIRQINSLQQPIVYPTLADVPENILVVCQTHQYHSWYANTKGRSIAIFRDKFGIAEIVDQAIHYKNCTPVGKRLVIKL